MIVAVQVGCIAASFAVEYLKFDWSVYEAGQCGWPFFEAAPDWGAALQAFHFHSGWLVATYATNPASNSQTVLAQCAHAVAALNAVC